jgi:hypothetical protein
LAVLFLALNAPIQKSFVTRIFSIKRNLPRAKDNYEFINDSLDLEVVDGKRSSLSKIIWRSCNIS